MSSVVRTSSWLTGRCSLEIVFRVSDNSWYLKVLKIPSGRPAVDILSRVEYGAYVVGISTGRRRC